MNGWIDDSDLPKLQSIQLDRCAFEGDGGDDQKTMNSLIYYLKNTLKMRSGIE